MVPTTEQARARVVEHLVSKNGKELRGRLGRAHQLVKDGAVEWRADLGLHVVQSGTTPGVSYQVDLPSKRCGCPDSQDLRAPYGWCKHLLAVAIIGMADEFQAKRAVAVATSWEARAWRRLAASHVAAQIAAAQAVA